MKKMIQYWNHPSRSAYLFLAPSVILLILFSVIPLVIAFGLSLFDVSITMDTAKFIGFHNFIEAFQDNRFTNSLKVTAIFTGLEVPIQVLGALVIAALITKNNKRNKIFRGIYFLPVICSATAIGIMWRMILHSNIGFITAVLQSMGFGKINFLKDNAVIIVDNTLVHEYKQDGHTIYKVPITSSVKELLGSAVSANIATLGVLNEICKILEHEWLLEVIVGNFPERAAESNTKAYNLGVELAKKSNGVGSK